MQNQLETLRQIIESDIEWYSIQIKASSEINDWHKASYYEVKKDTANSILNQLNEITK
jgi:hypothetical protein